VTENPESGEPDSSIGAAAGRLEPWDDLQVGFCGNPRAKLDERGRLKMPAEFKAFIDRKYGKDFNEFYITSREGLDAEIYPLPEWHQHLAKVFKLPPSNAARKGLLARYSLYGGRADMDPQGRLLLPEELRNAGLVNEDVSVTGEGPFLRVAVVSRLRQNVQGKAMPASEMDELAQFGL
jgi:transcriptional regulator MraZ